MPNLTAIARNNHVALLDRIVEALSELEFGAVEITVHHGRIVQIERREKVRLGVEPAPRSTNGEAQAAAL